MPAARPSSRPRRPAAAATPAWSYSPAPESLRPVIRPRHAHFIDGQWTASPGTRYRPILNPATATATPLSEAAAGTARDVNAAVMAARRALPAWSSLPGAERGKHLFRLARLIREKARELAVLESLNQGKPIRESLDLDLPLAASQFFYHAGWADKLAYAFPGRSPRPLGVCAHLLSWQSPLLSAAQKIAPALACGNTVVLKPAETTPLTALALARLIQEAGLPAGVVNIVTGPDTTSQRLAQHPDLDALSFTGSARAGQQLAKTLAATRTRLTLDLPAPAAQFIMDDAPLDQAVEGIMRGAFLNQGQARSASSRLLVQENVVTPVVKKLERRLQQLRVGDPLDHNTDVGAIHSSAGLAAIREQVASGLEEGARLVQSRWPLPETGFWFAPCFFTGVTPSHRLAREEISGPVFSILTFRTPEEGLQLAQQTAGGLCAGVWTTNGSRALKLASRLRVGVVWANSYHQFDPASPFGGLGESGPGRDGGLHGLASCLSF